MYEGIQQFAQRIASESSEFFFTYMMLPDRGGACNQIEISGIIWLLSRDHLRTTMKYKFLN